MADKLVVIVGETASGKSALAMEVAERFDGEIIAADSWTVYRGFDIGTAKPSNTEKQRIPHHLIDIREAADGFNAAMYKNLAGAAIADVGSRGKLPILVGGTGLYVDSVLFDYHFLPTVAQSVRDQRNLKNLDELLAEARTKNINLDGIDIRNKRRIIRALETGGQRPKKGQMRPNVLIIGIKSNSNELRQRITKRVAAMSALGLENEVRTLSQKYGWDTEPMKGIGYREWQQYFSGNQTLEETKEKIIGSSMNLAKRQRTWFKRNKDIQWTTRPSEAIDLVTTFLNTSA